MSFTPTVPAAGDPQTNTWTMTITDQASGLSGGTYELVFSDTPPTAGALASVDPDRRAGGAAHLGYDAATGRVALNFGSQAVDIAIGSTVPGGPQNLSQLSSTFSPVGVTKDGSPAGTFTGVTIDENGLMSASYSTGFTRVIYQIPVVDVPNFNGLRVLDNQTFGLSRQSGSMFLWDAGVGPDRGDPGLRARAVDHRHRPGADPADPDPARLFVERQDHPDGRRDAAGNHQPQALTASPPAKGPSHEHLRRPQQRGLRSRGLVPSGGHHLQQRRQRADAGLRQAGDRAVVAGARAATGRGVRVTGTARTENAFLTAERRGMDAALGAAATTAATYERISAALGEPGAAGVARHAGPPRSRPR